MLLIIFQFLKLGLLWSCSWAKQRTMRPNLLIEANGKAREHRLVALLFKSSDGLAALRAKSLSSTVVVLEDRVQTPYRLQEIYPAFEVA